jgi:hypothetical protein
MSKEYSEFNCSQDHEHAYVAGLFENKTTQTVRDFLKEKCASKELHNSTHKEVYKLLEDNGFIRK